MFSPYNCDSYKLGHKNMYPDGATFVFSNITPRSDKHLPLPSVWKDNKYVVFGLSAAILGFLDQWKTNFFSLSKEDFDKELETYSTEIAPYIGPCNNTIVEGFRELYALGNLPLDFKVLPEGSVVDIGVPCMVVSNTDERFYWLVNYVETWLSTEIWKPITCATIARFYRRALTKFALDTGGSLDFIDWQAHDFSMRGMSNIEDSTKASMAHLLYFTGSDTLPAMKAIKEKFDTSDTPLVGGSVPATEHSVMCSGNKEDELQTFKTLMDKYPSGVLSVVSDTWDYWKVLTEYASQLKDQILSRVPDQFGLAKLVFRPDSGDPVQIICGSAIRAPDDFLDWHNIDKEEILRYGDNVVQVKDKFYAVSMSMDAYGIHTLSLPVEIPFKPEYVGSLQLLWDVFGGTITSTGHKLLNERVGLIYGDSMSPQRTLDMFTKMQELGWCSSNLVVGVGSFTYSYITRDSLGIAIKATHAIVNGEERMLFKDPITDDGTKKSAKGMINVLNGKMTDKLSITQWLEAKSDFVEVKEKPNFNLIRQMAISEAVASLN